MTRAAYAICLCLAAVTLWSVARAGGQQSIRGSDQRARTTVEPSEAPVPLFDGRHGEAKAGRVEGSRSTEAAC